MRYSFIIFILVAISGWSQTAFNGVVLDADSNLPVPYATLLFENKGVGTSSNAFGAYEFKSKKKLGDAEIITVSCLGYASKSYSLTEIRKMDEIILSKKSIELGEFVVFDNKFSAQDIMRIAFGKLQENCSKKPYQLNAFYRHYCSENDVYGRLIEAAIQLQDGKGHKRLLNKPEEKVQVKVEQLRRSYDYTKNFDEHDPISIYSTVKYDVSSYMTMLHSYPDEWNFRMEDTTYHNGNVVWVVGYNYDFLKNKGAEVIKINATGRVYVNASDFGILKIQERQENSANKEYENHAYQLDWEVSYQKFQGKYYLSYAKEAGWNIDEKLGNDKQVVSRKDHRFQVEIMVNAILLSGFEKYKSKEPTAEELAQIKYDEEFWSNYTTLKSSPLDLQIVEDLEKEKKLQEQFKGQ